MDRMENKQEAIGQENAFSKLIRFAEMTNIATDLDDNFLTQLGRDVCKWTKKDDASRDEWRKKSEAGMKLALQVGEEKTFPWKDASNVKYPLITVSALQFHARAYPSIVSGNKVVKGQVTGEDPQGVKADQAERIANYMNYQLLEEMEEWDEQMDKMLLALPIEGCAFKKTYFDPTLGRNVSEWVRPIDFIVNYKTKDLSTCPRQTHRLWFHPQEIKERQNSGVWLDIDLNISVTDSEEENLQEFYEQHCLIDIDDDGYKEPYCVTVHKKTEKVIRIKAGFYPEDITIKYEGQTGKAEDIARKIATENQNQQRQDMMQYAAMAQAMLVNGIQPAPFEPQTYPEFDQSQVEKIVKIDRNQYFTKFSFIPSPDGGFYDIGFGQLIGPLSDSIDTTINQMIDAGTLSNLQSGFIRKGTSINGKRGDVSFKMGEFKSVELPGNVPISDAVMPFRFGDPSLVLFQLLGFLVQGVKDITGVQDIMTGGAPQNETATTTMARIEQGMQVFTAVYKRIYRSLKKEFKKIYRLNSIYLKPETYFRVLDSNNPGVVNLSDFRNDGTDVQPVADPTLSTTVHKMAKAQVLMSLKGDPGINQDEINKRYLDAIGEPNVDALIIPAANRQPPPDPKLLKLQLDAISAQRDAEKTKAEIYQILSSAYLNVASADAKTRGIAVDEFMAQVEGLKQILEPGNEQGRVGQMEDRPTNQGSVGPAQGTPEQLGPGELGVGQLSIGESGDNGVPGGLPQGQE